MTFATKDKPLSAQPRHYFLYFAAAVLLVGVLVTALAASGALRWMFGLAVIPALALGAGMLLLPESPRWLLQQGRANEAARGRCKRR